MPDQRPIFRGANFSPNDAALGLGHRPVIFDVLTPNQETSLLDMVDKDLRLVLYVNPRTMNFNYTKVIERVGTRSGFVEFHWGDGLEDISFEGATGGFMRLYSGLSNITGYGGGVQGRRETLAYSKYIDLLALFHNNGAIYDRLGNIVLQGYIKLIFDGGVHIGWFSDNLTITESASTPFMFNISGKFLIDKEIMQFRSANLLAFEGGPSAVIPGGLGNGVNTPESGTAILDPIVGQGFGSSRQNPVSLGLDRDEEGNVIL